MPYTHCMSTQTTPAAVVNPREQADVSYTLVINARQLHYIQVAMREFVASNPDEELDDFGQDIPTVLEEMLSDPKNPLLPSPAVNGLTL